MFISSFNIKQILLSSVKGVMIVVFILMFFFLVFKICIGVNHSTHLKLKNGYDISLYQQDSAWVKVWGTMKAWNNFIIENDNRLGDSNYIRLSIRLRNLDTITLNNFSIKLWHVKNNISKEISDGRIYYDPGSCNFDDYHLYQNMTDTFKNYIFTNPSWNFGTLLVVQSKPSTEIEKADHFIADIFLDCIIDGQPIVIHKADTLYKKKEKTLRFSH